MEAQKGTDYGSLMSPSRRSIFPSTNEPFLYSFWIGAMMKGVVEASDQTSG